MPCADINKNVYFNWESDENLLKILVYINRRLNYSFGNI